MKELIGKYVVIAVKVENRPNDFIYNGKLMNLSRSEVMLDDVQLGKIVFPREVVKSIREMNRMDMIELARKYERWAIRLKMQQADDKVKKRFDEWTEGFKKTMKG
jgi:hypothetical protein